MRYILALLVVCACGHHEAPPLSPDAAAELGPCYGDTCTADEYCYLQSVGAVVSAPAVGCNPLPASCTATPTCACVVPTVPSCSGMTPSCEESDGVVTIACAYP
jgi:hypothetical protein